MTDAKTLCVQVRLVVTQADDETGELMELSTDSLLDQMYLFATSDYPHSFITMLFEQCKKILMDAEPI